MPKLSDIEKRQAQFKEITQAGAPDHVAQYALDQNPSKWISGLYGVIFLILLIPGGIMSWRLIFGPLQTINNKNAITHAVEIGATLYKTNFGFSAFFIGIACILCSGTIACIPSLFISEKSRASSFIQSTTGRYGYVFKPKSNDLPPPEYIKQSLEKSTKFYSISSIILLALSWLSVSHELKSYTVLGPSHFYVSPLNPLKPKQGYTLEDVIHVELGCSHTTGKSASDSLVYKITFNTERSVYLDYAKTLSGTWLENVIEIDRALRDKGVEFRRWSWKSRNPLHPACLEAQRARYTAKEYDQILDLLQVNEIAD